MKVLMAEDLQSVHEHLRGSLAEFAGVELRFVAQDAALATLSAASWRPEVVILEVRMRGAGVLGTLAALKKEWPDMVVVISAFFFEPHHRQAYLRQGADFFFDKSLEWRELVEFLRKRRVQDGSTAAELAPVSSV